VIDPERGQWTSASNSAADLECPGRHLASRNLPEEQSADSSHGTAIHLALATHDPSKLSLEQAETYEACEKIALAMGQKFFGNVQAQEISEKRMWADFSANINGQIVPLKHSGKVDRVYFTSNKALILEFKTLTGDVPESPRNQQLRDLAVLVWGGSSVPAENGLFERKIKQVGTVVIQPLVTHSPELCVYEEGDLARAELELYERVARSNDPNSKRVAGEVQCKFCKARKACPEYQAFATKPLPMLAKSIVDVPVSSWDGAQCALFLAGRTIAEAWLEDAYNSIKARIIEGLDVPGYQLRDGNEVRKVENPQLLFDRFALLPASDPALTFESKLAMFMQTVDVPLGRLKEAVNTLTGIKGQKLDATVDKILDGAVKVTKNKPSIVKKKGTK